MKARKLVLLLLLVVVEIYGQENKGISIGISAGITSPLGDYQSYTKSLGDQNGLNQFDFTEEITGQVSGSINGSYNFGGIGLGANVGIFKHKISKLTYENTISTQLKGGSANGSFFILGPDYTTSFGDFKFTGSLRGGIMNFSLDKFTASYNGSDASQPIEILSTELAPESKSTLPMASVGVKFSYPIYKNLYASLIAEYVTTFDDGFEIDDRYYTPFDANNDGNIGINDVNQFVNIEYLREDTRFLKPQMFNLSVGLSYWFGDTNETSRKAAVTEKEARRLRPKKTANDDDSDDDGFGDFEDFTELTFENESSKRRRSGGHVIVAWPVNNSHFTEAGEIEKFSWKLEGDKIENPNFRFEIFKIGENQEIQSVYVENTTKTETNHEAAHILQQKLEASLNQSSEGHYKWIVTETITGIISNDNFFRISKCAFNFRLINETVECISSDTDNRVFKICFDSYFSSPIDDLTFAQLRSGLTLFDQNNNTLTFNLDNPNPSLIPQSGTGGSTLYCLKVTVPNGVTSIRIRLQGDVINTGRDKCTPIAYLNINNLPYCACDECTNKNLVVNGLSITQNGTNLNQFNISGNLSSSDPIYGIEFQIQSYGYAPMSPGCTDGVTSVEESGMFLIPATTINNASVAMFNETISSGGNTNNLAAKAIQYMSSTPLTGTFPVNLTIGLPGPSLGQNPGSCRINYKVCIKAKVYFKDGSCTSCVFSDCFTFNNQ